MNKPQKRYSETSIAILKTVAEYPNLCATEIWERMVCRPRMQYVSSLLKSGLLAISDNKYKPTMTGSIRLMNTYSITTKGKTALAEAVPLAALQRKQVVYTTLNPVADAVYRRRTESPPTAQHTGCNVAGKRVAESGYARYIPPPQTGRGYVPRLIRSTVNL